MRAGFALLTLAGGVCAVALLSGEAQAQEPVASQTEQIICSYVESTEVTGRAWSGDIELSTVRQTTPAAYYGNDIATVQDSLTRYLRGKNTPFTGLSCSKIPADARRDMSGCRGARYDDFSVRCSFWEDTYRYAELTLPQGWNRPGWDGTDSAVGNLATATQQRMLSFASVNYRNPHANGYETAQIGFAYRFMICAGEVQFAYSLERSALRHSPSYVLATGEASGNAQLVTPDSEPPAPLTFPLRAEIETANRPGVALAVIADAIAGEALGMGCFSGQSKPIGKVSELIGPRATPEQAKSFLDSLRIRYLDDIPFALTHPRPVDPAIRAAREAQARAEQAARAEAERQAFRDEARKVYDQMMKAGQTNVTVDALLYPYVQEVIAEETAKTKAAYAAEQERFRAEVAALEASAAATERAHEAEMARWRAEVAESDRKMAEWRAEACRTDRRQCTAE